MSTFRVSYVKVREDLRDYDLLLPLEDGRSISTEDTRKFRTKGYEFRDNEEFNLSICLDRKWTYAINIDFEQVI